MLLTLVRKQLEECFRSYFINRKTGKPRSKGGIIGLFILFALLLLFVSSMGFLMAYGLGEALLHTSLSWLYFTVIGTSAILLGTFGSVFNSYAALYLAKDNELLLAMPIPPRLILLSRVVMVWLLAFLYSAVLWIPGVIYACLSGVSAAGIVFSILLTFIIPLLVTVITCALGWVIALIATKIRNKGVLSAVLFFLLFGAYMFMCANLDKVFESIMKNLSAIGTGVQKWAGLLWQLGLAASGDGTAMLIFTGVTLVLTALCLFILSRSFMHMVTTVPHEARGRVRMDASRRSGVRHALFMRELKRLTSSATYLMNACFSSVMLPVMAVLMLLNADKVTGFLPMLTMMWPPMREALPAAIPLMICLIVGMDCISLPSVSLEGKTLWQLQCLPVSPKSILAAKRDLHIVLNAVPAIVSAAVISLVLKVSLPMLLLSLVSIAAFVWMTADLGLYLGLKHPNLQWTSEQVVIKQNVFVLVQMLVCLVVTALPAAALWFLLPKVSAAVILAAFALINAVLCLLLEKWLAGKGAEIFMAL